MKESGLGPEDLTFAARVLKARCIGLRARGNLVHWHETQPVYLDWLWKRLKMAAGDYAPQVAAYEELQKVAEGDASVFEPLDTLRRGLVDQAIAELEAFASGGDPVGNRQQRRAAAARGLVH